MDRSKWEYKKLGDICILLNGFAFKSEKYVDNGIRVMRITNVQKGEIVDDDPKFYPMSSQSEIQRYMLKENDLLVSLTGNVGRVGLLQRELLPAALNQRVACLRLKGDSTDLRYLFHLMNSDLFENECIVNSQGIAQKNMSTKWLSDYKLPVPPKEDQQRIVAELDCLNEMIAVKQEQLKEFDKLAQSIFYDMFGDPMVNDKRWEVSSYGKIFEIGSGGTPSKSITDYWEDGDIPWIGSNMCQNCFIYDNDGKFITQKGLKNSSAKVLKTGTILFALVGATIGKVGILKKEMATNQNIAFVNVWKSEDFDSIFVFFNSMKLYPLFMNLGNGGFKMANQSFIKDLPIICPPLSLQQQFAEKISAIEAQKELVKQSIAETQALLDYTMDYYFND